MTLFLMVTIPLSENFLFPDSMLAVLVNSALFVEVLSLLRLTAVLYVSFA